ncbi:MAG: hypothetical protein H0U67_12955 [Gemmatimonadetes bacterium]|nr:hypothetical protein [Gemmatimonadota bacterium]
MTEDQAETFERVLREGAELQRQLPWLEMVMVGGSMAALHARHRYSNDTDHVTHFLREQFDIVTEALEEWEGWRTNRRRRPVLILGERHDVQLGVRQSRRTVHYQKMQLEGVWVPTPAEALRIKAYMMTDRQMTRDYLDVVALIDLLGEDASVEALKFLNLVYEPDGNQTRLTRFAEVSHQEPTDRALVDLNSYRGIVAPYNRWEYVVERCRSLGRRVLVCEMERDLPQTLDVFSPLQPPPTLERKKREGGPQP